MNWFHSQGRVKPRAELAPSNAFGKREECSPSFFEYPAEDGSFRTIKVNSAAEAETIANHFESENLTALAGFEDYKV